MRFLKVTAWILASASLLLAITSQQPQHFSLTPGDRALLNDWVAKCLEDFKAIKPGMTRLEVTNRLFQDHRSGPRTQSPLFPSDSRRELFVHPECPYFKIDIEFARGVNVSPEDKVLNFSKPYVEGVNY
jgi:hypothetical protein